MNKIWIIVLVALVLGLATLRSCLGPKSTTLSIQIVAAESEMEVKGRIRFIVGFVPEGKRGPPTLGNISIVRADDGTVNQFTVPPRKQIGVFVIVRGIEPIAEIVWLQLGEHLEHTIVLEALP